MVIDWILKHAIDIMAILWILDQFAAMTPENLKIGKFPIGKYDNIAVSFAKGFIAKTVEKFSKEKNTSNADKNNRVG